MGHVVGQDNLGKQQQGNGSASDQENRRELMIGFYHQSYGHGAARIPMPGIIDVKRKIGLSDDLSFWELIRLGEIQEAFKKLTKEIVPQLMMMILAGLLLFFMIMTSMKIDSIFNRKAKAEPVVICPKVVIVEKKEPEIKPKPKPKPRPKQPKIERKKKIIPRRKPPVKEPPKIVRKTPLRATAAPAVEKNPEPVIRRSTFQQASVNQEIKSTSAAPTPVRSSSFRPAQSMTSAPIERGRRPDVDLYDPDAKEEAHISHAGVRGKREGLHVSQAYSQTGPRSTLTVGSRGTSQAGQIEITGVSLASLEACPNSLDEIEFKKRILKVIGRRRKCVDASGEYAFYKTSTLASFNMIVKAKGGRKLRNRCDELNNAYQCIITLRE